MSAHPDISRVVRSWLREDEHESADHVLGIVLARVAVTPQRRSWWPPRRFAYMNSYARIAIAAAAVLVVVVVGYNLLPRIGGIGGQVTPVPTNSPASPTASRSQIAPMFPPSGPIAAGRQSASRLGVDVSFTVPTPDWTSDGSIGLSRGTEGSPTALGFIFWTETPVGVFSDPCGNQRAPSIGADRAALAAAITSIQGVDVVSQPVETTVGGRPATSVAITVREDVGCDASTFYLWYSQFHARYASELGFTVWTWIVDVDGTLIWIDGETYKGAGPEPAQAVQQLVDSISFE
jgi:hypothetical protein